MRGWFMRWFALLVVVSACTGDSTDPSRIDIVVGPEVGHTDGAQRMFVDIALDDGAPFLALLDTGSTGLRVLPAASPTASAQATPAGPFSFDSGLQLNGVVDRARFQIGHFATDTGIPIMLIDAIRCTKEPCPADGHTAADFTFDGALAILGVGMRTTDADDGVGDAIVQLPGAPGYIIEAPAYGGSTGTLQIDPDVADVSAFKTIQLGALSNGVPLANGVTAWDDHSIPTCVTANSDNFCFGGMFDTGDPPINIEIKDYIGSKQPLPPGTVVDIALGNGGGLASYGFTVGNPAVAGVDEVVMRPRPQGTFINLGTSIFFRFDVFFDQVHGVIGLGPK